MKNKILLTVLLAFIGFFTFNLSASAHPNHGNRSGKHKHISHQRGRTIIIWHNNNQRCGMGYGGWTNRGGMCMHMRGMFDQGWRNNIRCNHRSCDMYGRTYNQGYGNNNYGNDWDDNGCGRGNNGRGGRRGGR